MAPTVSTTVLAIVFALTDITSKIMVAFKEEIVLLTVPDNQMEAVNAILAIPNMETTVLDVLKMLYGMKLPRIVRLFAEEIPTMMIK